MKIEERQLLLKDICARIPYRTLVQLNPGAYNKPETCLLCGVDGEKVYLNVDSNPFRIDPIKPYLRPMSSMTEEEKAEYTSYCFEQPFLQKDKTPNLGSVPMCIDWLLEHHFDYRGLIPMGLDFEAPEGMYKN